MGARRPPDMHLAVSSVTAPPTFLSFPRPSPHEQCWEKTTKTRIKFVTATQFSQTSRMYDVTHTHAPIVVFHARCHSSLLQDCACRKTLYTVCCQRRCVGPRAQSAVANHSGPPNRDFTRRYKRAARLRVLTPQVPPSHESAHTTNVAPNAATVATYHRQIPSPAMLSQHRPSSTAAIQSPNSLKFKPLSSKFVAFCFVFCRHGFVWCTILVICAVRDFIDCIVLLVIVVWLCSILCLQANWD